MKACAFCLSLPAKNGIFAIKPKKETSQKGLLCFVAWIYMCLCVCVCVCVCVKRYFSRSVFFFFLKIWFNTLGLNSPSPAILDSWGAPGPSRGAAEARGPLRPLHGKERFAGLAHHTCRTGQGVPSDLTFRKSLLSFPDHKMFFSFCRHISEPLSWEVQNTLSTCLQITLATFQSFLTVKTSVRPCVLCVPCIVWLPVQIPKKGTKLNPFVLH